MDLIPREIELRQIEEIPSDVRVCHFDELGPAAKEHLITLVDTEETVETDTDLGCCEVVKFTEYYEVSVH